MSFGGVGSRGGSILNRLVIPLILMLIPSVAALPPPVAVNAAPPIAWGAVTSEEAVLAWAPSGAPGVVQYNVYGLQGGEATLLGVTTDLTYSAPVGYEGYGVSAGSGDGESPMTNVCIQIRPGSTPPIVITPPEHCRADMGRSIVHVRDR